MNRRGALDHFHKTYAEEMLHDKLRQVAVCTCLRISK